MVLTTQDGIAPVDVAEAVDSNMYSMDFCAMGTTCAIRYNSRSISAAKELERGIVSWIRSFEERYSRFKKDSIISRINRNAGIAPVEIDEELASIFALCDHFYWDTSGVFDPSALPLIQLWDYHAEDPVIPSDDEVESALELVGWKKVQRERNSVFLPYKGMALDVGGIGKEYAVDRVVEMALAQGVDSLMVNFGQDIRVCGNPPHPGPWRIGLENPSDPGVAWCCLGVRNRAVASSGDYYRGFEKDGVLYGHILDPRTGCPVNNGCKSVSVVAQTCTEAGIMSTTAFVLGKEEGVAFLRRHHHVDGCIVAGHGGCQTPGFARYVIGDKNKETVR